MLIRIIVIVGLLAVASLAFLWWSRRNGVVRHVELPGTLSSESLGTPRGFRATFVQFSTPMCAKCPGTAVLLKQVASEYKDVVHIEIDATERLDLARRFDVMRTPTILVLNTDGVVVARMSGPPSIAQAREALDAAPPESAPYSI
ncbi:thioredoxin family protein [Demequina aurantiaca]|uniref:thioredoxin family protein n=1 Tax=Demequina aurantiaca TaxID=676200 RepID=UPI0007827F91|nr:thioredoxin family protein [Demequina aurantiaca]